MKQVDSAIRDKYILKEEPKDAADVIATREKTKDKDDVVVVGKIGGRENPWIKGTAAFLIVDLSLKACNERPGDTCKTPWDYCCEADLPKATLFVTILVRKPAKSQTGCTRNSQTERVANLGRAGQGAAR